MKPYSLAKVSVRGQLTHTDYNNRCLIADDLIQIINLSGKENVDRTKIFTETGIIVRNMPLTEKGNDMGHAYRNCNKNPL